MSDAQSADQAGRADPQGRADHAAPRGVDVPKVTAWLAEHVPDLQAPLDFRLIAGGRSNLTYRVEDGSGRAWVLRRPPLGHVLATAHDMGREYRIVSALAPTDVPVPPVIGLCEDEAVNEAPFYVMEFVDGAIVRSQAEGAALDVVTRRRLSLDVVDVLARIHRVDPDAVGLGELGRKEAYVERQLRRWQRQWEQSKTRDLPAVDEVHAALSARIPEQGPAAIVHGDYRLDNCLTSPDGTIAAVLDWELCTLGDPLADVGLLLVYWTEAGDAQAALGDSATSLEGFVSRAELVEQYARVSGRDVTGIDYYVAFGYWKLACILEGVLNRYQAGVMGDTGAVDVFSSQVEFLALAAQATLDRVA